MQPTGAKHPTVDSLETAVPSNAVELSRTMTLPDDIIIYLGRFIVKYPAIHILSLTSHKLAAHAAKIFANFANEGGSLKFYSLNLERVAQFALSQRLHTINLLDFKKASSEVLHELFVKVTTIKRLSTPTAPGPHTLGCFPPFEQYYPWLRKLESFSLVHRRLSELSFIANMQALKTLRLDLCSVNSTPLHWVRDMTSLTHMNIRYDVPPEKERLPLIESTPNLRKLKLVQATLAANFLNRLTHLTGLRTLKLEGCKGWSVSEEENPTTCRQTCGHLTTLTSLKLTRTPAISKIVTSALDLLVGLKKLKLTIEDRTPPQLRQAILHKIGGLSNLTSLNLHYFGERQALSGSPLNGLSHLTFLSLLGLKLTKPIADSIKSLERLKTLSTWLSDPSEEFLISLKSLTALETLGLSASQLNDRRGCLVGQLTHLKNLYLVDCDFGDTLVGYLTSLTGLRVLHVNEPFDDTTPPAYTAPMALSSLSSLERLSLAIRNNITSLPLKDMPRLAHLRLEQRTTEFDKRTVIDYVCTLTNLRQLTIRSDMFCVKDLDVMTEKLLYLNELILPEWERQFEADVSRELDQIDRISRSRGIRIVLKEKS